MFYQLSVIFPAFICVQIKTILPYTTNSHAYDGVNLELLLI